jgi:hypothetical protein
MYNVDNINIATGKNTALDCLKVFASEMEKVRINTA